jgi:hypothetical protein
MKICNQLPAGLGQESREQPKSGYQNTRGFSSGGFLKTAAIAALAASEGADARLFGRKDLLPYGVETFKPSWSSSWTGYTGPTASVVYTQLAHDEYVVVASSDKNFCKHIAAETTLARESRVVAHVTAMRAPYFSLESNKHYGELGFKASGEFFRLDEECAPDAYKPWQGYVKPYPKSTWLAPNDPELAPREFELFIGNEYLRHLYPTVRASLMAEPCLNLDKLVNKTSFALSEINTRALDDSRCAGASCVPRQARHCLTSRNPEGGPSHDHS